MYKKMKEYQAWILCEDWHHYHFVRGFLMQLGMTSRKIDKAAPLPEGKGAGEQFVREHFPKSLLNYGRNKERKFLAVVLDVDRDRSPDRMKKILHDHLVNNSMEGIKDSDKLLLFFPKKNIETWFEWLNKDDAGKLGVNETDDYKQRHKDAKPVSIGKRAGSLYAQSQSTSKDCTWVLPSIQFACASIERLNERLDRDA